MNIPRQRRYPYRPLPRRITFTHYSSANTPAEMVKAITAAVAEGRREKWQGDE